MVRFRAVFRIQGCRIARRAGRMIGMRLLLIRHGQTPSNVLGALDTAVPGPGLTRLGRQQADAIPAALAEEDVQAVYASVQIRAQMTALPLALTLGQPTLVREGLREISAGDLEMRNDSLAVRQYHEISFGWAEGRLEQRMPGGEDGHEVFARFDDVVAEISSAGLETVACFAHGQIIRSWVGARTTNITSRFAMAHPLHNTAVITLEGSPGGWTALAWTGVALGGPALDDGRRTGPGGSVA
jgi:broad specificity phosphatase PhoE